jgi:hypothetical protein
MLESMRRRLPPEYAGWEAHETAFRRTATPELILEVQDGPPDRRLAALAAIDLAQVPQQTIEDWLAQLPDAEANELAGAIPVQRPLATCDDEWRWAELAGLGFRKRGLPTFLVTLMSLLEGMSRRNCPGMPQRWEQAAGWIADTYDTFAAQDNDEGIEDIALFIFENHLQQPQIFDAFCDLLNRHESLALRVSIEPGTYLLGLPPASQRRALEAAESGGGEPAATAWQALHNPGFRTV